MAKFHTYAEEVTTEHVSWVAYTSGVKKNPPGYPIKALLERNGGK